MHFLDPTEILLNILKALNCMGVGWVRGMNTGSDSPVSEYPELVNVDVPSVEKLLRCVTRDCMGDPDRGEERKKNATGRSAGLVLARKIKHLMTLTPIPVER